MPSYGLNPGIAATPKATPRLSWPSPGGSSSNSGQYGPRSYPESIDLNRPIGPVQNPVMDAVEVWASLPARAYEMPLSVLNTLGKSKPEDKGPIDQLSDLVDSLPIVGDIAHGAGNVIEESGKVFPTFWNAPFASALKDTANLPNDHVIDPLQTFLFGNLGDLFGGKPFTVGQLRQQAFERGFTQADIAALGSGRKGLFDFGGTNEQGQPYAVSPNQLLDLAGRIVLDPLNATVVLGPARVAKLIPGAEKVLGLNKARALVRENAALDRALGAAVKGPRAGVRALAAGVTEGVTNRSVGLFLMGMSKGGGALLGTYRNAVAIPTAVAVGTVNAIDYALNGNDAPSGPFKDVFALGRAIADDRPLSQGMLFNLWAVTHFPVVDSVKGVTTPLGRSVRKRMPRYRDIQTRLVDRLVPGSAGDAQARLAKAVEQAGGEDNWAYLIDMLGRKWHADRIADVEFQRNPATNMLELQESANLAGKLVDERMRANPDEFGGREADAALVDWATGARLTSNPNLRKAMGGLRSTFDPERFFVQFRQWLSVAKQASAAFSGAPPVAPALRRTLIKEHLQVLKANLRTVAKDGSIPAQEATRLLLDHPALLEAQGGFWARAMIRDGQDIAWEWARDRLDRLIDSDQSYTMSQVIGSGQAWAKRREREAVSRAAARRPDGSYDLSAMEVPGSATVHVPTADDIARSDTMTLPDQLDDALAARANGTIDAEDIHALDMAGAKVLTASDGISIRDGALAPGKRVVLDPTTTPQMAAEVAAKLIGRTTSRSPATIVFDEAGIMQHGLTPNSVRLQWRVGGMDDLQRQGAVAELNAISDLAWADDATGTLTVILRDADDMAGQMDRASSRLGALFPDRAPDGLLRPQMEQAWIETIRDTGRSRSGRAARAAGTERSVADVAAHGERGTFWHAADVEFAGVDERRLAGMAEVGGPEQGPVGQAAAAGQLDGSPGGLGGGQVDFALDRPAEATRFDLNYGSPFADFDPLEDGNGIREKVIDDPNLTPMERVRLAGLQEDLFRNDPTYTLEVIPKGATPIRAGEHPFADMVIAKQAAGDAWSYRVGSALGNGMHAAFGRVYTKGLQDDMRQELMSSLVSKGATPSEVNGFLAALHVISQKVDLVFGHPRARADHLDPKTIRNVALGSDGGGVRVITGFDGFTPETLARLGGADKVSEVLSKASSRVFRKLTQNHRAVDGKGVMGKLLDATFGPSKRTFEGGTGRRLGYLRTYYPLLRFYLDPRWWLMNKFEADIIGAVRYGARRGEVGRGDARAAAAFGGSEIDDLLAAGWLDQREEMGRIMARSFREERIDSATKAVEALASDSKELTALRERVGDIDGKVPTGRQLAEELDRMMYDYDVKGVPQTVEETARRVLDDAGYEAVRPLIGRLTDVNRKQWESLFNGFRGNVNRSNAERMLNSYFLYWPLSYQLKVAKLLVDTLTNRSFGRQTDMLGAWTVDRLWREHTDRLEHDRDYRAMFDENPTLWTMAGMMLPVTPFDIGLSESRITRYMQSNVGAYLGFWDKDGGYPSDPIEMASRIMNLGPLYTADLLAKANRELKE